MNEAIIRIAEAMGWIYTKGERISPFGHRDPFKTWHMRGEDKLWDYLPFNPLTSHDDCHALIEWLRTKRGCAVVVGHYDIDTVTLYTYVDHFPDEMISRWKGPDYRIGVVELTLKVLDEMEGKDE